MTTKKEDTTLHKLENGSKNFGDKAADKISGFAGSWGFIIGFIVLLIGWMIFNIHAWIGSWDPYPFILLNLVLSCIAAFQAPIILMSQNRAAEKDRKKLEYDYTVNRKAERGIENIQKRLKSLERKLVGCEIKPRKNAKAN